MKRLLSNVAVALVALYSLAVVLSAASAFWKTPGKFGFTSDYGATVRAVTPGGPAARAGITAGDRIRLSATPFEERRYVAGVGAPVPPGAVVHVRIFAGDVARDVRLVAVPAPLAPADRWTLVLVCVSSLIFIAVGTLLIIVRPSKATWGFGLYCLLALPADAIPLNFPSASVALFAILAYDIVQNLGVVGLVLFTLEFPHPLEGPRRALLRRWLPALFVVLAVMTLYPDVSNLIAGIGAQRENVALQLTFGLVFALAMVVLFDTFRHVDIDERERVRWLLAGFAVGLLTNYIGTTLFFSTFIVANPPAWLINTLVSLNVLLPLTVAHAVIRHRVLDINFVIGRALMFTALTTVLAAVFGILDWLFGHVLEDFRLSRLLAAALSIAVAFAFGHLEKITMKTVEAMFFRKRRAAEAHVERSIRALPHARSRELIQGAIVDDVADTLEIASAALYRLNAGGAFERTASRGWSDADCALLDDTDPLVLMMRAESRLIQLDDLPWTRADLPGDGRAPHAAVPMLSHAELAGFMLYGAHPDGASLDPDELAQIGRLVTAAGLAFDQLDAQHLRAENERQAATIAELRARLDELRRA